MKLGVRAHDYGKHSAKELAKLLRRDGFSAAQLAVPKAVAGIESYQTMSEEDAGEIERAFQEYQIEICVLGCYVDISCGDRELRERQLRLFEAGLFWGARLHAGMVGTESSYGILDMDHKKRTWELVVDGVSKMAEQAQFYGVDMGIEPVAAHTLYSVEWTRALLDRVKNRRLKVILDPVNLLTEEWIDRQEELWDICFDMLGKEIEAIHLKDFVIGGDGRFLPCPLGEGLMRYDRLFERLHQEKNDINIIREELVPKTAQNDIIFMKGWIDR